MLQIFNKKKFLVDYLEGFIDIHNHILPGIDDGAKTVEESIELINAFSEFGVTHFIATPHIMHDYYPNDPLSIAKSFALLKNGLQLSDINDISISTAAEHMIDSNFEQILERGQIMPLAKNHILIEMSYLQPSINFEEAIQKITSKNFFPIFAHPERYIYLKRGSSKYLKYKEQGLLFQLNILSISQYYGKEVQQKAMKLIENGLIDFIASDVHNLNQLELLKKLTVSTKTLNQLLPIINTTIDTFFRNKTSIS